MKRTEADMLALLRARHAKPGNGGAGEWAFMTHVRDEAGFNSTRTIDALALSLWPSRGFELHGFEVKVSRSDWLRELADPAKADWIIARCDRFWLVAAEGVAQPAEIPTGWGLLVAQGAKLRATVQAPKLKRSDADRRISRSWLVCMLRAGAVPASQPADIEAAYLKGYDAGAAAAKRQSDGFRETLATERHAMQALRDRISAFEQAAGFSLGQYGDATGERARRAGELVRSALDGESQIVASNLRLRRMAAELIRAAERMQLLAGSDG